MEGARTLAAPDRAADREARFAAFVVSHRERARRLAWRLVGGDAAAADDVAQDAFLNAWRALDRFRGEARLATWFYRILVRQAANHRRWRGVRERFGGSAPEDPPGGEPADAGDPVLRRRISAALDRLSRGQREAFVLVHLEGFTVREAADVLGKAPGTIKSHLHRALTALRRDLGDLAAESGRNAPMTEPPRDDVARESRADPDAFVETLRRLYAPPPLRGAARASFDAGLEARRAAASRRRLLGWTPALAALAAAAVLAWGIGRVWLPEPAPEVPALEVAAVDVEAIEWEEAVFFPATLEPETERTALPDEYRAIAAVFLDDRAR